MKRNKTVNTLNLYIYKSMIILGRPRIKFSVDGSPKPKVNIFWIIFVNLSTKDYFMHIFFHCYRPFIFILQCHRICIWISYCFRGYIHTNITVPNYLSIFQTLLNMWMRRHMLFFSTLYFHFVYLIRGNISASLDHILHVLLRREFVL